MRFHASRRANGWPLCVAEHAERGAAPLPLTAEANLLPPDQTIRHEYRVGSEETAPLPEPRGGPNSPASNSPPS